jgi:hypothetical protein
MMSALVYKRRGIVKDIIEPALHRKITQFLDRKSREYPELGLPKREIN